MPHITPSVPTHHVKHLLTFIINTLGVLKYRGPGFQIAARDTRVLMSGFEKETVFHLENYLCEAEMTG